MEENIISYEFTLKISFKKLMYFAITLNGCTFVN